MMLAFISILLRLSKLDPLRHLPPDKLTRDALVAIHAKMISKRREWFSNAALLLSAAFMFNYIVSAIAFFDSPTFINKNCYGPGQMIQMIDGIKVFIGLYTGNMPFN